MDCTVARELIIQFSNGACRTKKADREFNQHRDMCAECNASYKEAFDAKYLELAQPSEGSDYGVTVVFEDPDGDRVINLYTPDPDNVLQQILDTGGVIKTPARSTKTGLRRRSVGKSRGLNP